MVTTASNLIVAVRTVGYGYDTSYAPIGPFNAITATRSTVTSIYNAFGPPLTVCTGIACKSGIAANNEFPPRHLT